MASSSPSSSSSKSWMYDVFLSFRGEDTRNNFTGHLYMALKEAGINVFIDDDELRRGEDITAELTQAIQGSRISVIVFSQNYAASCWCLEELVKIMDCRRTMGQMVLPIFYDVDPSDVRKQTGRFGKAYVKQEDRFMSDESVGERWRSALTQAANLSGWDLRNTADGHEAKFIRIIVEEITENLNNTDLCEVVYPVGIGSRLENMSVHLDGDLVGVRMIGIWGMSGIGKTTLAKAIYNKFYHSFEGKSFLANVSETAKQPNGLVHLQEQLLSDIWKPTKLKMDTADRRIKVIKERLARKRVLVIVDDIDQVNQLQAIAGNRDWFCSGSRIIVTTRDEQLLKQLDLDAIYLVPELNSAESLELFSRHAFKNGYPIVEYYELSRSVAAYCGGLPLALEVLGSFLLGRTIPQWESALEKLKRFPYRPILEKLRISFDGLNDDDERNIFLDISCFFIGMDKNYVSQILDGCGFYAEIGLSVLLERRLVTVSETNKLMMHDLIRDMGREIVREKYSREPGKHSRLWHDTDVSHVLSSNSGTKEIEGLALNLERSEMVSFSAKAFAKMHRLRLLQLNYVQITGGYKYLSKELRWLCWHGFPLEFIPNDFYLQNLIALDMKCSKLTHVWKDPQSLKKLKILNLSHSHYLRQSPDFSKLPNLEELKLKDCKSLLEVHQSIGHLERLSLVNLKDCKLLKDVPRSLYKSKSIKVLVLSGCSRFENLAEDVGEMVSLTTLRVDNTAVRQLPLAIVRLKNLKYLSLCGLKGRANSLPSLISSEVFPGNIPKSPNLLLPLALGSLNSLRELALADCYLTAEAIPNSIWSLPNLENLDLASNSFDSLPSLCGLSKLKVLSLNKCTQLYSVPNLPTQLVTLLANDCTELERMSSIKELPSLKLMSFNYCPKLIEIPDIDTLNFNPLVILVEGCTSIAVNLKEIVLQGWNLCAAYGVYLPGSDIPEWFTFVDEGAIVHFQVPRGIGTVNGLIFCVSYSSCHQEGFSYKHDIQIFNRTTGFRYIWWPKIVFSDEAVVKDQIWVGHIVWKVTEFGFEGGYNFAVVVNFGPEFTVKKTGVCLVYDGFINGDFTRSISVSTDNGLEMESSQGNDLLSGRDRWKSPNFFHHLRPH